MAKTLKVTPRVLTTATQRGRLFSVDHAGETLYPRFLADPSLHRRALGKVCEALGDLPGWEKLRFFTTPKLSLQRKTPLEALREGELGRVLVAAAGRAER